MNVFFTKIKFLVFCYTGSETRLIGRLMVVSGKTGRVLRWMQVPDDRESYYSPQVLTHPDGKGFFFSFLFCFKWCQGSI